jgi:zinc protease
MSMTLADFKNVINQYMNEKDQFYLVVGDKTTQLKEVSQLKGKVIQLDSSGNVIGEGSN